MNHTEQQYLTGLVEKAFKHIEWYDTIGYKSGFFSAEMMADQLHFGSTRDQKDENREVRCYRAFRASELYSIAKEELRGYVLSDDFRNNVVLNYFHIDLEDGRTVPDIILNGSINIDITKEVRNYLIEVSRVGSLFEYQEPFRNWFTEQFLQNRKGRDTYIRGACRTLLHQSRERRMSFDDALGFEMEAVVNPEYLAQEALQGIHHFIMNQDRIQERELYEAVQHKIKESSPNALLFSHPVIQYLVGQGVTHAPRSIPALRLEYFLKIVDKGAISAFEHFTPYPLQEALGPEIAGKQDRFSYWYAEMEKYSSLVSAFKLKRLQLPAESAPTLTLVEERMPERRLADRVRLVESGTLRFVQWKALEQKLLSRKVVNHLLNDPTAYNLFEGATFAAYESWPMVIEQLGTRHRAVLEALVEEIKTGKSLRLESKFRPEIISDRSRFTSEVYPSREIEGGGKKYTFEIDRNLVSIINILFNREERDQTLTFADSDAPQAIARVLADFDDQFISVYTITGERKNHLGAVWLDGSDRLGGDRLDYYDEIDDLGQLAPLRTELLKYAEEFAHHCGYRKLEFDSNDLIGGIQL